MGVLGRYLGHERTVSKRDFVLQGYKPSISRWQDDFDQRLMFGFTGEMVRIGRLKETTLK